MWHIILLDPLVVTSLNWYMYYDKPLSNYSYLFNITDTQQFHRVTGRTSDFSKYAHLKKPRVLPEILTITERNHTWIPYSKVWIWTSALLPWCDLGLTLTALGDRDPGSPGAELCPFVRGPGLLEQHGVRFLVVCTGRPHQPLATFQMWGRPAIQTYNQLNHSQI